jgi:hypothetical protein
VNEAISFWGENYVNKDCDITVTSGDTTVPYLYDQKPATALLSSGSNDTITETTTIAFKNWQGNAVTRTFDRIVIQGHNLKAITAEYYNGSAWVAIAEAALTLSSANTVISIATPISAQQVRLNAATTQVANAEKYIGELKICAFIVSLGETLSDWQPSGEQKSGSFRLAGGAQVAWKEWTKISGVLSLENVSKATKDALLPYLRAAGFITLAFYPIFDAAEVYEFSIVSAPAWAVDRKASLFSLSLELQER